MNSRDKILNALRQHPSAETTLPVIENYEQAAKDNVLKFKEMLTFIGGNAIEVSSYADVISFIQAGYPEGARIITNIPDLTSIAEMKDSYPTPQALQDVQLAIIKAHFAVAENGAVWITNEQLPERVLPFITEYLAVVVEKRNIVSTLHEAYDAIGSQQYGFGVFIAGPSKTSDIEQSLVLGAHGPKSMIVFLLG